MAIRITEYMYTGTNGEFVEFTNTGNSAIDMTGWSFDDNSRTPGSVSLSAFGSVAPSESVILTESAVATFRTAWSLAATTKIIGSNAQNLGRGDEINIYDASNTLVDRLTYDDQNIPGTIRTQNRSGWVGPSGLGANNIALWTLSATGDVQQSYASTGGDIGTPGLTLPIVNIVAGTPAPNETGAVGGTFNVTLSRPAPTGLTLNYTVTASGATNPADFTGLALGAGTLNIVANSNTGTIAFTTIDDTVIDPNETVTVTLNAGTGYYIGATPSNTATLTIADNDSTATPSVTIAAGTPAPNEAGPVNGRFNLTLSSAAPAGGLTVNYTIAGTATSADFSGLTGSATITAGQTTVAIPFTTIDDTVIDPNETVIVTLAAGTGYTIGAAPNNTATLTIADNDSTAAPAASGFLNFLGRYSTGAYNQGAAEIPAYDPGTKRLFVVNGATKGIDVISIANPSSPALLFTINIAALPTSLGGAANSVAVKNGIVAAAVENANKTLPGTVEFFNADLPGVPTSSRKSVVVGALPDMLTFTPDGTKVVVANEGEPNSYGQAASVDPEGSVSIVNLAGGVDSATATTAAFTAFNSQQAALTAAGVRVFGPNATVAQDFEPEYIAVSPDSQTAWVTLQENNALALLNLATGQFTNIVPLGFKNHNTSGNGIDPSDRDNAVNIRNVSVLGMYQPDAIASFQASGQTYLITANEGDARDYTGFSEEVRVGAAAIALDAGAFPDGTALKTNANLGRLTVTNALGDTDGDKDFDRLYAFGSRSFSIRDASGNLVYDSGDALEQITARAYPNNFNADHTNNTRDDRSDNKGPEPEGVTTGTINGRTYAFIGLERVSGVVVYDVSNPTSPAFVQYINSRDFTQAPNGGAAGDLGPEGLIFISAADSPNGKPLLVVSNEVSGTTSIFEIDPTKVPELPTPTVLNFARLTSDGNSQVYAQTGNFGSIPLTSTTSFNTQFRFRLHDGDGVNGADGFTFVIQDATVAGATLAARAGGFLGYNANRSLAVEFDTHQNDWDPNGNHVAVLRDGSVSNQLAIALSPAFDLNSGDTYDAWLEYSGDAKQLRVYLSENAIKPAAPLLSYNIDLSAVVGSSASVGFTSATGALRNVQDVGSWRFATNSDRASGVPANGSSFSVTDFSELQINGSAALSQNVLRLVAPDNAPDGKSGSAFLSRQLAIGTNTYFETRFKFKLSGGEGDGFALTVQDSTEGNKHLGLAGGYLGYFKNDAIARSLAVEFDTYKNTWDSNDNHVAVLRDGQVTKSLAEAASSLDLNSGASISAWVEYQQQTLRVFLSGSDTKPTDALLSYNVDLSSIVGSQAYIGFSGATGALRNTEDIESWQLTIGNIIRGGAGNDTLAASGVNDRVFGEAGDDIINAGTAGGSVLTGGGGADTFQIVTAGVLGASVSTIADFEQGVDKVAIVGLTGVTSFANLALTQQDSNAIVAAAGTNLAVLTGIQASSLNASSFTFS